MSTTSTKTICMLLFCALLCQHLFAHNGSVAYAYPLGKITIDGDFADWPRDAMKYKIGMNLSDTKPTNEADFSGFFKLGYRLDNRSLYIAFTITDDYFMEDTCKDVRWNTLDGLELSIDARHLLSGSGVASFMYSKKLRNTNNAFYDPFAKNANWHIMEVAMVTRGNTRFYEWRISLGEELVIGKSIGFDFHVFDKDADGSFSFTAWGNGGSKYMNPNSLGDIIPLPADEKLSALSGKIGWDKPTTAHLPGEVRIINVQNKKLWLETAVDSLGNYAVDIPAGKYDIMLPDAYFASGDSLYSTGQKKPSSISVKAGQKTMVPLLTIPASPVPDLIPDKGILHDFTSNSTKEVDRFVETYQSYFGIPGVSLALIKDGRLV